MNFKEYLYLAFVVLLFSIPVSFCLDLVNENQQKQKDKRINDSLLKIKTNLEIELLRKKLK